MGRRTGELPPARPFGLERVHRAFYGPRPGTLPDLLRQLINRTLCIRERVADRRNDFVRLRRGEENGVGVPRHGGRQGRQSARPGRQVVGGQQVDGAARTEGLDQRPIGPQSVPHVGAGRAGETSTDRELGRAEHLGMSAAQHACDGGGTYADRRLGQRVALHPSGDHPIPGQCDWRCRARAHASDSRAGASVWRYQDPPAAPEGPARRRARPRDGGNGCRADVARANPWTWRHLPRTHTPR